MPILYTTKASATGDRAGRAVKRVLEFRPSAIFSTKDPGKSLRRGPSRI